MKINLLIKTKWVLLTMVIMHLMTDAQAQTSDDGFLPEANRDYLFDYTTLEPIQFDSFAAAAKWADVVAIVQVVNVDYEKTRQLNAKGQAFLTVRVPYKGSKKDDLLIVNSNGFEEHICYYPDREGEGERLLVFLKQSSNEGEFHGFKPYCGLQVLLTDTGQYALRIPLDTNSLKFDNKLINNLQFNDPHARIDATEWTGLKREDHQKLYDTVLSEESNLFQKFFYLTYTKGIMMYQIRKLMDIKTKQRITSKQM